MRFQLREADYSHEPSMRLVESCVPQTIFRVAALPKALPRRRHSPFRE